MKQQQDRFWCGIGAVILPAIFVSMALTSDDAFKAMPLVFKMASVLSGVYSLLGGAFCWIAGLINWATEEPAGKQ